MTICAGFGGSCAHPGAADPSASAPATNKTFKPFLCIVASLLFG
jgi:hypothetical protein